MEPEGTSTFTWGTSAAAHEIGRIKEMSGLGDDELYTYDSAGRRAGQSMTWAGKIYSVGYSYNSIGALSVLSYPLALGQVNPFQVQYAYSNGLVSSVQNYTGGVAGTMFWQLTSGATNVDAWGHTTDETLGTTTAVRIQSGFDAVTGLAKTRTVGSGASLNNLQNLAYQWDVNANLSERKDLIQNLTEDFNYDNLNRIQTSTLNGTQNLAVSVDNVGNITSRTEGGISYSYTYDTTHKHAVATVGTSPNQTTYTYDANGNMLTRNGQTLQWASYNLPTSIPGPSGASSTIYYGPDRQRKELDAQYVSQGQSGLETTVYAFGVYEHETTPAQAHDKYFVSVPGGTQIIYDIQSVSGVQTTYVTADHLGSGNLVINTAGTVLIKQSYSAYGYRRSSNWAGPLSSSSSDYGTIAGTTRRGYTDAFHEMMDNVNLIHMNGRVYDPAIGRFISPDPLRISSGTEPLNPYSYASNNPLSYTDPTGFAPDKGTPTCDLQHGCVDSPFTDENGDLVPGVDGHTGLGMYQLPPDYCTIFGCTHYSQICSSTYGTCDTHADFDPSFSPFQDLWNYFGVADKGIGGKDGPGAPGNPGRGGPPTAPPSKSTPTPQGNQSNKAPCPSHDRSLSRPSYWDRVSNDATAANDALGTGLTKGAAILGTGALSKSIFGTSAITPFKTWFEGAAPVATDLGEISGAARVGAAIGLRVVSGAAVYAAWRAGNYVGAMVGNISWPGGPTVTDGVSAVIDFEANGPSGAEPPNCSP